MILKLNNLVLHIRKLRLSCSQGLEYAECILSREESSPHGYNIKLNSVVRLQSYRSGECKVPLHCHDFQVLLDPGY